MKTKTEPKLRKAYKAVVDIPEESLPTVLLISRAMIHLWNMAIDVAQQWLDEKKPLTAYSFNYWLTEARELAVTLKDGTVIELDRISSDLQREVLRKLAGSYQSFFELKKNGDGRARMPWKKDEETFQTLSWSSFSVVDGAIIVPGMDRKSVRIPLGEYLQSQIQGKNCVHATLARRDGRFELSIVTAVAMPDQIEDPTFYRAVDLGAGHIAVTDSDGSEFLIPARRSDKHWLPKIRAVEQRADGRTKGSWGHKKLMKARRRMFDIAEAQHVSHQRKLADALVEDKVQCIVIGKAKTRLGLAQSSNGTSGQHRSSQNTGYMFRLLRFIEEKAEERGVKIIRLPDPPRAGSLDDPESKLFATRNLLAKAVKGTQVAMPLRFVRKGFSFKAV